MPVIKVWCLPSLNESELNQVFEDLVKAVEGVPELGLKGKDSITVLFPPDMMRFGLGTEIIIEVTGLFEKPERTEEVRNRLAEYLGKTIIKHFPSSMVECFVFPFNVKQGFWTRHKASQVCESSSEDSVKKYPPIAPGTQVKTTEKQLPDTEWSKEVQANRKWGVKGVVLRHYDSHGLCYDVRHEDGTEGCYDPSEFEIV